MEYLYHPGPFLSDQTIELSDHEARHLRVLRKTVGDAIALIDGKGTTAAGVVAWIQHRKVSIRVTDVQVQHWRSRVRLCLALCKPQAMEEALLHSTELGVDSIALLVSDYAQKYHSWNAARWVRIIEQACKQSGRAKFSAVLAPVSLSGYLVSTQGQAFRVLCDENDRRASEFVLPPAGRIDLLIGSEGGWSDAERQLFAGGGFAMLGLGPVRLRVATAALTALTLVKQRCGEFQNWVEL